MQRISTFRRLARRADIKARRLFDVDMLIGAFRDPAADDREILFLVRSRRMRVDKGCAAGLNNIFSAGF